MLTVMSHEREGQRRREGLATAARDEEQLRSAAVARPVGRTARTDVRRQLGMVLIAWGEWLAPTQRGAVNQGC